MANKFLRLRAAIRRRAESLANVVRRTEPEAIHGRLHPDNQALDGRYYGLLVHVDRSDR